MKNNICKISIAVIMIVVFITFLSGCNSDNQSEQENSQITTVKANQTLTMDPTREQLKGWRLAYRTVITDTLRLCKEKQPDEINHGQYGLYDFDFDREPELFVKIYGTTTLDEFIYVYDFDGNNTVFLGEFEGAHSWIYGTDKANAFLTESYWMGESVWNIYELQNGKFVSEKLAAYYPDGFGDIIESQENPLQCMGYEITSIEYYNLDDLSSLK